MSGGENAALRLLREMDAGQLKALARLIEAELTGRGRRRGFEVARGFEGKVARMPQRATPGSGGYDFWPLEEVSLNPGENHPFFTGVKAYMPPGEILLVNIRSSYGIKYGIELCNGQGWIDSDYYSNRDNDGVIIIKVKNNGDKVFTFKKEEPFAQGMFISYHLADGDSPRLPAREGGIGHSTKSRG
ncbi:MAG: dCTP deaminase/dUTPase family protein [Eubacteriales bacterium]